MRQLAAVAGVLVSVMCFGLGAQTKDDAEIVRLGEQYAAAFNKADVKALGAMHTAEALRLTPDGRLLTGRAAIEKDLEAALTGPSKGARLTIRPGRTQSVTADVMVSEGTYEVTGGSTPAKGRYVNTLKREGDRWLLASVVTMRDPAQ